MTRAEAKEELGLRERHRRMPPFEARETDPLR